MLGHRGCWEREKGATQGCDPSKYCVLTSSPHLWIHPPFPEPSFPGKHSVFSLFQKIGCMKARPSLADKPISHLSLVPAMGNTIIQKFNIGCSQSFTGL